MSLLLDALKKSEAQRRRESPPTIDLTRTPPSGNSPRPGSRWLAVALAGVLLVAAAPWFWPQVSDWLGGSSESAGEPGTPGEDVDAAGAVAADDTAPAGEPQTEPAAQQVAPAPVAGASSPRRVAAAEASPAAPGEPGSEDADASPDGNAVVAEAGPTAAVDGSGSGSDGPAAEDAGGPSAPDPEPSMRELRRTMQARQEQARASGSNAAPQAESVPQVNEPVENFIRPWELPQSQRAEFPELRLTVHFYAEGKADRFVLINGERYREGQRVGPGTRLVEIRQRGAVVEFGSYRVLIE